MDNGKGNFELINEKKYFEQLSTETPMVFKEGEILEVRGSRFIIKKIQHNKLVLKLLPSLKQLDT